MDTVTVVYSRSRSVGSMLVRAGAWWGPWSHCGVVHGDHVFEARAWSGVVATPLTDFVDRASECEFVQFEVPDAGAGYSWLVRTLGSPYDWGGVLGIPFRDRDWQRAGRWYCSEHVEAFLHHCGLRRWRPGLHGISPCMSYFNASVK